MKARDRQEGLDRATDELAAHRWMAVLYRLDRLGPRVQADDPALQAKLTTATLTGKELDAIQSGHPATLEAARVEGFVTLQAAVDLHQHPLQIQRHIHPVIR
jgi:hypothetical protein